METRIYAAPAVKGLKNILSELDEVDWSHPVTYAYLQPWNLSY